MKQLGFALGCLLLLATFVLAEDRTALYTSPDPLPREVLDRLNLRQTWVAHIPMESRKDGIFSVQFPEIDRVVVTRVGPVLVPEIVVQTRSGLIVVLDRDSGQVMWQKRVGRPYQALQLLAFNSRLVLHTQGLNIYALDRRDGSLVWDNELPAGPMAAPLADENQIYIPLAERRLHVYELPDMESYRDQLITERNKEKPPADPGEGRRDPLYSGHGTPTPSLGIGTESARSLFRGERLGPKLGNIWDTTDDYHAYGVPILTINSWVILGSTGTAVAMSRWQSEERMKFRPGGALLLPPGAYAHTVYIAAENRKIYSLNTDTAEVNWEYGTGTPIVQQPIVAEDDVYVSMERQGVMRLDRLTGEPKWKSPAANADRVLATNPKFVYAMDRNFRMLVLDRARGTELSRLDNREFPVTLFNEHTDRILLGAQDGTIVCLGDKEYPRPQIMKNAPRDDGGKFNPLYRKLIGNINTKDPLNDKPLRTMLDFLDSEFKIPLIVRREAFRDDAAIEAYLDQPVTLEKVQLVPLGQVLDMVLRKVKSKYSVRPGYILIEPDKDAK